MSILSYLETAPLSSITKYSGNPPKDAVPFTGFPRQHPSEKGKLILIYDPLGTNPAVLEFKLDDVLYVEDIHSAVTEAGEGVPLVKLWIRKGAHGVILEPFEVSEPASATRKIADIRDRFFTQRPVPVNHV
jgi:hypothetical protein